MEKLRFFMPIGLLLIVAVFSTVVMLLWNWLMPAIFGIATISFWQALGLFILARIFFGSFGFFEKARMHGLIHQDLEGNPIHKKWMRMSAEERKEFIEKRRKFGFGHPHPHPHPFFDMEKHDEEHGTEGK